MTSYACRYYYFRVGMNKERSLIKMLIVIIWVVIILNRHF